MKKHFLVSLIIFLGAFSLLSAELPGEKPIGYWSFDSIEQGKTKEEVTNGLSAINGNYRQLSGVKDKALVFDGYTTCVVHPAEKVPELKSDFTISAWIALGAYPWNWAPIVAQENTVSLNSNLDHYCWPDDIEVNSLRDGFYFGVSPEGYLGLMLGTNKGWIICRSESKLPLRKWVNVVAVFKKQVGLELYIDGKKVAEKSGLYSFSQAREEPLRIGMNREKREPAYPVRPFATLACWYSFDGLIDEIKIFNEALSLEEIAGYYPAQFPKSEPELPVRVMPSGPEGPGKFGAYYTTLNYYPEWDRLWRVAKDADVVVQFDNSPVRVVFWRGTRCSPVWVMDRMHWMSDQSLENFTDQDGCLEHMLDLKCEFSHVRIIENTEARVVVHWRYSPVAADGTRSQVDPVSGWPDWADEYYTFYPDQTGVRKVILHTTGGPIEPENVIPLCHPGQRPEDVVDLKALTIMNLKGQHQTYDWSAGPPKIVDSQGKYLHFGDRPEEKPIVLMVNMKSEYKPYQIVDTSKQVEIFDWEYREGISHFPWWNHWPVAQIPSDGRYSQAPDRESHICLARFSQSPDQESLFPITYGPQPPQGREGNAFWWAWLYGATNRPIETLLPLAKSWANPPEIRVYSNGYKNHGYDLTQRCYLISKSSEKPEALEVELIADEKSPVYNPALYIENWGDSKFLLRLNGNDTLKKDKYRVGYVDRLGTKDLVIWLGIEEKAPTKISLIPEK